MRARALRRRAPFGRKIRLSYGAQEVCFFSTEKIQSVLPEFKPRYSLEDGVRIVVDALKSQGRILRCEEGNWEDRLVDRIWSFDVDSVV